LTREHHPGDGGWGERKRRRSFTTAEQAVAVLRTLAGRERLALATIVRLAERLAPIAAARMALAYASVHACSGPRRSRVGAAPAPNPPLR
jgi:hypothetical protein